MDGLHPFGSCSGHPDGKGRNGGDGYHVPYVVFTPDAAAVVVVRLTVAEVATACTCVVETLHTEGDTYSLTVVRDDVFNLESAWRDIPVLAGALS